MFENKKIYDITRPLVEGMITYPDNTPLVIEPEASETTFRSRITFGSHTGTHIDAPSHAFKDAQPVDEIPLTALMGECRVLDLIHVAEAVAVADLEKENIQKGERILVKTKNSDLDTFGEFDPNYVYLDGDAADYMAEKEVTLFGIDYLSVKQKGSNDVRAHTSLLSRNIPIIEGLIFKDIEPGRYTVAALPLPFSGLDGSPARVILIS